MFVEMYSQKRYFDLLQMHNELREDGPPDQDKALGADAPNPDDFKVETDMSVKARTDEEIGEGHVDDGREKITVADVATEHKTWADYKNDLLGLLDKIEEDINDSIALA